MDTAKLIAVASMLSSETIVKTAVRPCRNTLGSPVES